MTEKILGYFLRPLPALATLAFWALATAAFGTILAMGLVVSYSDPLLIPWALLGGGVGGLILALFALGWEGSPSGSLAFSLFSLLALGSLLLIRLFFPLFSGPASLALLGLMEGYGALLLGRLRGVIEEFVTEREKTRLILSIRLAAIGGGLSGGVVGILATPFLSERTLFWLLGIALVIGWALPFWCRVAGRVHRAKQTPLLPMAPVSGGLKWQWGGWIRLMQKSSFLQWLAGAAVLAYLFRTAAVAETLRAYSTLAVRQPLFFFSLLIIGSGAVSALAFGVFRLARRRLGPVSANLTYPVLAFAMLVVWLAIPGDLIGPLLTSVSYLALMPALFLNELQSSLRLFPGRFARTLGHLLFGFMPPIGLVVGSLFWLLADALLPTPNRLALLLFLSIGLVGAALAVGLFYRRAWLRHLPTSPLKLGERIALPKLTREEREKLLAASDPISQELGLRSATQAKDGAFLRETFHLLKRTSSGVVRRSAYAYLATFPARLSHLLSVEEARMGVGCACLAHSIGVESQDLNHLLNDESPSVRALGCLLGWQQGLGEVATRVWEGIDLNTLSHRELALWVEAIPKGAADPLIRMVKKLAWYPSPEVRRSAVIKMGDLLEGREDPNLLEVAVTGLESEDSIVRTKALSLLIASGVDNAAMHAARYLGDSDPAVREAAAHALAATGGWELAASQLTSLEPEVVEGAIRALTWSGTEGEEVLSKFLRTLPPRISPFRRLGEKAPVNVALKNAMQRAIRWTAVALEAIGEGEAASLLQSSFLSTESLDLLYRLVPRSFLDPIAPLLRPPEREQRSEEAALEDLQTLARSEDPFIQAGARLALDPQHAEPKMNRLLFLKNLPYFHDLLLEELSMLDVRLEQVEFLKGETIFEEGGVGDRFYLIYQGSVALTHEGKGLAQLEAGQAFGEMALFGDEARSATAKAAADTILLALDKSHFHELIRTRPAILLQVCRELSHRLREMDKRYSYMFTGVALP